jgi:hypothetical protein
MTEQPINLPALRSSAVELMDRRTDSWTAVVEQVAVLATRIADTELVPRPLRNKPAAVAAVILYGREIGLPPMTALRTSYVVNGSVALKAEVMRALILAAGHRFLFVEASSAKCIAAGCRAGSEDWQQVEWTIDLARKAGVTGNPAWQNYPRQMLKARATAELARDLFPDVIGGFVALEEIDDGPASPEPSAPPRRLRRAAPRPAAPESVPTPRPGTAESIPPGEVPLPGEEGYDELLEKPTEPPQPVPGDDTSAEEPKPERRDTSSWAVTDRQLTKLHTVFAELDVQDRDLRLRIASLVVKRDLATSKDLTRGEAIALIDTLERIANSAQMRTAIRQIVQADDPMAALDEVAARVGLDVPPATEEPPDE